MGLADPPALVEERSAVPPDGPVQASAEPGDQHAEEPWLVHRVQRGENLSRIGAHYYGPGGDRFWPTIFRANVGTVMGWTDLGRGHPIRLTDPDYLLAGCDLVIPPVPGRLEMGPSGEVINVVQP